VGWGQPSSLELTTSERLAALLEYLHPVRSDLSLVIIGGASQPESGETDADRVSQPVRESV